MVINAPLYQRECSLQMLGSVDTTAIRHTYSAPCYKFTYTCSFNFQLVNSIARSMRSFSALQRKRKSVAAIRARWSNYYKLLQTAFLFAGCTYACVLKYGLGLCCVRKNTYYKTIQKLVPIVTCLLNTQCSMAKQSKT